MTNYVIRGGKPLFGEVEISGFKNAAVAIIPAALLVDGVCRIENIPQISDVTLCLRILENLGAGVRSINPHTVEIDCTHIRSTRTSYDLARKMCNYWTNFAKTGDPNGKDRDGSPMPQWTPFTKENPQNMQFFDEVSMSKGAYSEKRAFLLRINQK